MHPDRERTPSPAAQSRAARNRPAPPQRTAPMPTWTTPDWLTKKRIAWVVLGMALTLLATLVVLNLTTGEQRIKTAFGTSFSIDDPQFVREMGTLLGPPILRGNTVEALDNGDEIFPAMLAAIDSAEHTVTFETYVYWSGEVGDRFADALAAKAREGVAVHVLVDWAGALKADGASLDRMAEAGVQVEQYRPLAWYRLGRMNNRTHRKILVVDGEVGFTGGVGIADVWAGDARTPDEWRDMHFRVEGPVVLQMQAAFLDNWIQTTGRVLNGPAYFPPTYGEDGEAGEVPGTVAAHVFTSSAEGGSNSMRLMYMMALASAASTIDLASAYFVPDPVMVRSMINARERGVAVRVLVPGPHLDSDLVRISSKEIWGDLLAAGVEISVYQPTMLHTKMLIVDRLMVSVGSTNFDVRSFELNDEASLNLYDAAFAEAMTETFEADWADGRPYTYAMWEGRPWTEKFMETVVRPLKSQL